MFVTPDCRLRHRLVVTPTMLFTPHLAAAAPLPVWPATPLVGLVPQDHIGFYIAGAGLLLVAALGAFWWQRRLLARLSRQAEALRRSGERLTLVIEGGGHRLWDWNLVTGRVERNERITVLLGYGRDEIPATFDGWMQLVHPEDAPRFSTVTADDAPRQ
jgi:PAS domain-containing protein